MSIIKHILGEELERLEKLLEKYRQEIDRLPKGSLAKKQRYGNNYIYLAYRDGKKVIFKYIGKESSDAVKDIKVLRKKRLKYLDLQRKIKEDISEIKRAIFGRRR